MTRPSGVSQKGVVFVGGWEGFRPEPYNDAAGNATIGFGHLLHKGAVTPADRKKWGRLTYADGLRMLHGDLAVAEAVVRECVRPPFLWQCRFDAICSFVFNVGAGAFEGSELLRRLNSRTRWGAANELLRWDHADGRVLPGLANRRRAERRLFLTGRY